MTTETIIATDVAAPTVARKAPPQTATITLTANGSVMSIVAERKADGGARTYIITTDAAKKSERGMTEHHTTFEAAKAAIATRATQAEKLGWTRRTARRGFVAKPDAFTALPAAPKAKR